MKLKNVTYLIPYDNSPIESYIFFDVNSDISMSQSNNITDNPIDAIRGSSLQDNKIVDMVSVGVSGAFSSRNEGREFVIPDNAKILFKEGNKRLESIVNWFEDAMENATVFKVCKKGSIYDNQLLNSIKWTFDDSYSKIGVSLSFIEMENIEAGIKIGSVKQVSPSDYAGKPSNEFSPKNIFRLEELDIL